jgi:hypothetical protein
VLTIDKHKEYSRLIEDIADVQALGSLRRFYTDDAGYAIAKRVDKDLILEAMAKGNSGAATLVENADGSIDSTSTSDTNFLTGDGSTTWDPTANTNTGNSLDLTDLGIRRLVKRLDDVDAPMAGRVFVIPTVTKQDLMGLPRFTEQAFTGESAGSNTIRNGLVGNAYANEFYVTTQLPAVEDEGGTADQKAALYFQKDAIVLIEQMGVRSQSQYKQEYLGFLYTSDVIYGTGTIRSTSMIPLILPATATE